MAIDARSIIMYFNVFIIKYVKNDCIFVYLIINTLTALQTPKILNNLQRKNIYTGHYLLINWNRSIIKYVKSYCIFVYLIIKTLECPSNISKLCHYPIFKTKNKQKKTPKKVSKITSIIVRCANA